MCARLNALCALLLEWPLQVQQLYAQYISHRFGLHHYLLTCCYFQVGTQFCRLFFLFLSIL